MSAWSKLGLGGLLVAAACLLPGKPCGAQDGPLDQAIARFHEGEWGQAVEALTRLLEEGKLADRKARSRARKFIGMGYMALGQEEKTLAVFKDLVRDDPSYDVEALFQEIPVADPEQAARAVRLFGQALVEVRQEEIRQREAQLLRASRRSALLRSAVLPGWGQRYLGYKNRGYLMLGLAVTSFSYALIAEGDYRSARDDYRKAPAGADFDRLYDHYTTKSDRANIAWGILGGIWLLNMVDAVLQGPNVAASTKDITFHAGATRNGLGAVLQKRF